MNVGDALARYEAGESTAALAREAGISQVQMWRRIGRPARYRMKLPTEPPEPLLVAWAAGFFDGEGCIQITRTGRLVVVAAQATPEPLLAIQKAFGGNVTARHAVSPRHKDQWAWQASGQVALDFLRAIRPHLRVKGELAALAEGVMTLRRGRGIRLSDADRIERMAFHNAAIALNSRGRAEPST